MNLDKIGGKCYNSTNNSGNPREFGGKMKIGDYARRKELKDGHFVGWRKVVNVQRRKDGQWFQFQKDVGRLIHDKECWRPVRKYHVAHSCSAPIVLSYILDFFHLGQDKFWCKFMEVKG